MPSKRLTWNIEDVEYSVSRAIADLPGQVRFANCALPLEEADRIAGFRIIPTAVVQWPGSDAYELNECGYLHVVFDLLGKEITDVELLFEPTFAVGDLRTTSCVVFGDRAVPTHECLRRGGGGWVVRDDWVRSGGIQWLDQAWTPSECETCPGCQRDAPSLLFDEFDYERMCEECLYSRTSVCEECGSRFWNDDEMYSMGRWGCCVSCTAAREDSGYDDDDEDMLLGHSWDGASRMRPEEPDANPLLGIELECESRKSRRRAVEDIADKFPDNYIVIKRDGSLDEYRGMEVVTRPDSYRIHAETWANVIRDGLAGIVRGYYGYECGMHVHVGRDKLTPLQLGKMLVLVNSEANRALVECVAQRPYSAWSKFIPKKITDARKYAGDRYQALNTTPDNTVEFRIFRSNVTEHGFLKNLQFVVSVVKYCAGTECSIRDVETPHGYLGYLRKHRKEYPELYRWLIDRKIVDPVGQQLTTTCVEVD